MCGNGNVRARHICLTVLLTLGVAGVFWLARVLPKDVPVDVLYAVPLFLAGALLPKRAAVGVALVALGLCTLDAVWNFPRWTAYELLGFVVLLAGGWWAVRTGFDNARLRQVTAEAEELYRESEKQRTKLTYQALHDDLTGLPNRVLMADRLQQAILAAQRANSSLALLLMDLDRFKDLNDTLGHDYGDALLRQIGPCLQGRLRQSDTVARLGGDEFAVLLPAAGTPDGMRVTTQKLLQAFETPFEVEGHLVDVGASIGIALYPEHGSDAQTLLRHADVAMYAAKRKHEGYAFYAPKEDVNTADRLVLTGELRQAIDRGELMLHYQPKVGLVRACPPRAEALVRWQHPQRGLVLPDSFIPLSEQTGLIRPLSRWLLDEALRQTKAWREAGLDLNVAINLSMRDLHDPSIPGFIEDLLVGHEVQPAALSIEITESVLMADPQRAFEVVTRLSAMGLGLTIDDFGTGYSSLAYLKRLPVEELKIDKSFVEDMHRNENDAVIVRSTIDMAHSLGLRVVAEGVETRQAWELLVSWGCDAGQGYFFAKPMPAEELQGWLASSPWASRQAGLRLAS